MFKPRTTEEIREMGYDEFKQYVYSVPREYERKMKYPEVARLHGRTVKECKQCYDAIRDIYYYLDAMEMPEEDEIMDMIIPIKEECLTDEALLCNYPYIIIPFTEESYVFEEVREAYAKDAKRIINERKGKIRKRIEKYAKDNGITGIDYAELTKQVIEALNKSNATKSDCMYEIVS